MWAEMAKVTFQVHNRVDNVIFRRGIKVELTDVSTQADLIPGNSVKDIGFSTGGGFYRGRREPKKVPTPLVKAPPLAKPVASFSDFSVRTFKGDLAISSSAAEAMEEEAPEGKTDNRIKGKKKGRGGGQRSRRNQGQVAGRGGGEIEGGSGGHGKGQSRSPGKGCGRH